MSRSGSHRLSEFCVDWYLIYSNKTVSRGHQCRRAQPTNIQCDICRQPVPQTEYDDHIYCHQLESAPQTDSDADLARHLQREQEEPDVPRTMRLPPNIERMMTGLPPQFQQVIMQIRNGMGGPQGQTRVTVRTNGVQQGEPILHSLMISFLSADGAPVDPGTVMQLMSQNGHYNHGQGLDSSAIDDMPVTTFQSSPGTEKTQCVVCITDLQSGDQVRTLPCFHKFHKTCIDEWLSREGKCPICKRPVTGN